MKILTAKERMKKGDSSCRSGTIHVDRLYPSIEAGYYPGNYALIRDSIEMHGLKFPIVVWETTVEEWLAWANANAKIIGPDIKLNKNPTKRVHVVLCGNNRLAAGKELGYDYIDVIMVFKKEDANKWCKKFRKYWRKETSRLLELEESHKKSRQSSSP